MIFKSMTYAGQVKRYALGGWLPPRYRDTRTMDLAFRGHPVRGSRNVLRGQSKELICAVLGLIVLGLPPGLTLAERMPQQSDIDLFMNPASLPQLIRMALERNPGLRAARSEIDVAGKGLESAKGQRFGRVEMRATDSTYGPVTNKLVTQTLVLDQSAIAQRGIGAFNHNLFGFGGFLTIPIYTGGRITNQIAVEEIATHLAEDRLTQTRDSLIFNVSSTYYGILKLREFIRATEQSTEQLRESKRVVEGRFHVGKAAAVDVFKISTRLAAVEQAHIRLHNAQQVLHGVLNTLLGIEAAGLKLKIQGELTPASEVLNLNQNVDEALRRRPEVLAKDKQVAIQEKKILIARADLLPSVSLNGSLQGFAGDHSGLFNTEFANLAMSMPIFTGGTLESRVAQERLKLEQFRQESAETKLAVTQEVHAAYLNVGEAEARIQAAQAALAEAKEVLRVEQLKVSVGRGITENLLYAQTAELEAMQNVSAAIADSLTQRMALKKAVGSMTVEE